MGSVKLVEDDMQVPLAELCRTGILCLILEVDKISFPILAGTESR